MTADRNILAKARRDLEKDVSAHRKRLSLWRERLYAEEPRLGELEREIRQVFFDALKTLSPGAIEKASVQSLELQKERAELLLKMGASADSLEEIPLCPECNDTGYTGKELCACLLERYRIIQVEELSSLLDLRGQSFDTFNAELFSNAFDSERNGSPRQQIEVFCELCYNYCRKFGKQSENLLFSGPPGTGKTFLSACVAGAVSERGVSVVYDTAVSQLSQMETEQFGRGGADDKAAVERLLLCDLLIIDDLGAEFLTPFAQSALLTLINTRNITGKKMLINTNLDRGGIRARYSPALASRLTGDFIWLDFFGDDLRQRPR